MKIDVTVPEGSMGPWKVEKFSVSEEAAKFASLRMMFNGGRGVPAGDYVRLTRHNATIMSNTPDEIRDHMSFIYEATGHVLIHGLGLGVIIEAIKDKVDHITVIEIDQDVIDLVGPHYKAMLGDKIDIICADAMVWKSPKGAVYDAVWHDIWDNLCEDNLDEMKTLHRRYGRKTKWQGSWGREFIECHRNKGFC